MKLLFRLFLGLSFLLLGSHGIFANAHKAAFNQFSVSQQLKNSYLSNLPGAHALTTKYLPPDTENDSDNIYATETETEDESNKSVFVKRHLVASHYFTTFFYACISGDFSYFIKKRLPFCEHSAYYSSYRYLTLLVIKV